jgi:Ulp1 family protease
VLFQFPFKTHNSELVSVAHELNELNISPSVQSVRSEDEMFDVCNRFGITITNSDLYHMFPYNFITDSVIDLWSQW